MASFGISSEWIDKLSVLTRDFFDPWKVKQLLNVDSSKSLLNKNNSILESIPSHTRQMLMESGFLYEDMYDTDFIFPNQSTQKGSHKFPNIFSSFEEKVLLSSNIIHRTQDLFQTVKKTCMQTDDCGNFRNIGIHSMLNKNNFWFNLNLDLASLESVLTKVSLENSACVAVLNQQLEMEKYSESKDKVLKSVVMEVCDKKSLKPCSNVDFNEELMIRKTKELTKHSKKRRRRQKRKVPQPKSSTPLENKSQSNLKNVPSTVASNCEDEVDSAFLSLCGTSQDSDCNSEVMCVTIQNADSGIKFTFYDPASATSDEDSEWDTGNECDQSLIEAEFEFSGLFVTNFVSPTLTELNHFIEFSQSDEACEIFKSTCEISAALHKVNKHWTQANKDLEQKPKLPSKVSFASDDVLVKTMYIEQYERKGEWEIYATERLRFKRRIENLEKIISPCLSQHHRMRIFQRNEQLALL